MNIVKGEGVPDFVLLEQLTEDAMYQNIKIRYDKDIIYVSQSEVSSSERRETVLTLFLSFL